MARDVKDPASAGAPVSDSDEGAPWLYRKRFTVFAIVYGLAFFIGFGVCGPAGIPQVPSYRTLGDPRVLAALALLCGVGGYALRVWASSYLSGSVVWHQAPRSTELRVSGPYRFTRNPLYLGNILQAIGIGLIAPWPVLALIVPAVIVYSYFLIIVEERFLAGRQGAGYDRYLHTVARLIPLPGRIAPNGGQPGSLRAGTRSEIMTGLFALFVVIGIALTWR